MELEYLSVCSLYFDHVPLFLHYDDDVVVASRPKPRGRWSILREVFSTELVYDVYSSYSSFDIIAIVAAVYGYSLSRPSIAIVVE